MDSSMSLSARIDSLPISRWHTLFTIVCCLGLVFVAFTSTLMGTTIPQVISEFKLTDIETGLLLGSSFLGMFVGATLFGAVADKLGRRFAFQLTVLTYTIFTGLTALSPNWIVVLILRFITGLGLGGLVPVNQAYLSEYVPARVRGRILAWFNAMFPVGIFIANGVTIVVGLPYGWRWVFATGILPALLIIIIRRYLPESTRYLLKKGELDRAVKIVEELEERVLGSIRVPTEEAVKLERSQARETAKIGWRILFRGGVIKTTIVFIVIWVTYCFITYAIGPWMLVFLGRELKYELAKGLLLMLITQVIGPIGQFTSGLACDFFGRRVALTYSAIISAVSLYLLFLLGADPTLALLFLTLRSIFTASSWGAIYAFTPESFPTEVRATASGFVGSMGRLAAFLGPIFVGIIYSSGGLYLILLLTIVCSLITAIAAFCAKETKRKVLEEIAKA